MYSIVARDLTRSFLTIRAPIFRICFGLVLRSVDHRLSYREIVKNLRYAARMKQKTEGYCRMDVVVLLRYTVAAVGDEKEWQRKKIVVSLRISVNRFWFTLSISVLSLSQVNVSHAPKLYSFTIAAI